MLSERNQISPNRADDGLALEKDIVQRHHLPDFCYVMGFNDLVGPASYCTTVEFDLCETVPTARGSHTGKMSILDGSIN